MIYLGSRTNAIISFQLRYFFQCQYYGPMPFQNIFQVTCVRLKECRHTHLYVPSLTLTRHSNWIINLHVCKTYQYTLVEMSSHRAFDVTKNIFIRIAFFLKSELFIFFFFHLLLHIYGFLFWYIKHKKCSHSMSFSLSWCRAVPCVCYFFAIFIP